MHLLFLARPWRLAPALALITFLPAQDLPPEGPLTLERVVVTGSQIPLARADIRGIPVATITRSDIARSGFVTTADLLTASTLNNGGGAPLANSASTFTPAASSISLRGLGSEATLVLINGRRVATYPRGQFTTTPIVDLNSIPLAAIDRIEILKDGASANYGADAVAGVVNIILRREYTGSIGVVSYGNTTRGDVSEITGSFTTGATSAQGGIMVGFNYQSRNALFAHDRAYSAVPAVPSTNSSPANLSLSRDAVAEALGQTPADPIPGVPAGTDNFYGTTSGVEPNQGSIPANAYHYAKRRLSLYNYNTALALYPEQARRGGFTSFEYRPAADLTFYGDLGLQEYKVHFQTAPTLTSDFASAGAQPLVIPARTAHPLLTPDEIALGSRTAAAGAFNPANPFNQDISGTSRARLSDFGNRLTDDKTDAFLGTLGVKIDHVVSAWSLDLSLRRSSIDVSSRTNRPSLSRLNRVLNANDPIFNPGSSQYIGTTVAYNPFGQEGSPVTTNAPSIAYATVPLLSSNRSRLTQAYGVASNSETFLLPAGPLSFAVGGDYRNEGITQRPALPLLNRDIIGDVVASTTDASRDIGAFFVESEVPLVSSRMAIPGVHELALNVAGRYEQFITSHRDALVPKVSLQWLPLGENLLVRSSWGRGIREPSLFELFAQGPSHFYIPIYDPATQTSRSDLPGSFASNPLLNAEKTESANVGFVYTPSFVQGITLSVDYWRVVRRGTPYVDLQNLVNRAYRGGPLLPGEIVRRDSAGNLLEVDGVFRNLGASLADGLDFALNYAGPSLPVGRLDFGVEAVWTHSYRFQPTEGAKFSEYAGQSYDTQFDPATGDLATPGTGNDAILKWKGSAFVRWTRQSATAQVTVRHWSGFADYDLSWDPHPVSPHSEVDLQAAYTFLKGVHSWSGDTTVTLGVRNLLDTPPPGVIGGGFNQVGYASSLFTAEQRFVYVSLAKKY